MLNALKNHPFGVEAHFDSSVVLTFAVPKEELVRLIPQCVTLDTYDDRYGFVAVAMVQTKSLRPAGFPKILGNDFFLIGYRIFIRHKSSSGRILRGLYILKSETNKRRMTFFGNLFTHYGYTTTDIRQTQVSNTFKIESLKSKFRVTFEYDKAAEISLAETSPFRDWKEARRFAGPLPFTITYDSTKSEVVIIEGVRQNWIPRPIRVLEHEFDFLSSLHLGDASLANAFIIEDVPYSWKKGVIEKWPA